jgi:hypothetical protein
MKVAVKKYPQYMNIIKLQKIFVFKSFYKVLLLTNYDREKFTILQNQYNKDN